MKDNKFIKTFNINSIEELFDIIKGRKDCPDLRKNFIFRGINNSNYDLLPSSLRKDNDGFCIIDNFIKDSDFKLCCNISLNDAYNLGIITDIGSTNLKKEDIFPFYTDKYLNLLTTKPLNFINIYSENEIFLKKELYVLLKFLDYSDKSGLYVPFNKDIRKIMQSNNDYNSELKFRLWPNIDYFEIISLAQHHGLPTCALDWSYDYNVALYFAVKNILNNDNNDCVLWAFNYKKFEVINYNINQDYLPFPLQLYRPEYNKNPNLAAQKGLFTFWITNIDENIDLRSFEERLIEKLESCEVGCTINDVSCYDLGNFKRLYLNSNEKLFYKFVIPGNLKRDILTYLYLEDYSEEFLFPGYYGVVDAIKNKVILDKER